jgi:hypothetical protein
VFSVILVNVLYQHSKSLLGCPFKMATIDTAIALALQQFKVDRLKAEQKSNFSEFNSSFYFTFQF